jgi:hypothetical protein
MNFVGQAPRLPMVTPKAFGVALQIIEKKRKLSEPMAIGFNSSKAFGGGNWRKK